MKAAELRDLSDQELTQRLDALVVERFNLRFQQVTGQLENPIRLRDLRRDIARVKTVSRMREITAVRGT